MYRWMRFFSPDPADRDQGLVCLGVGVLRGALPRVGPRVLDRHVAVIVTTGGGWVRIADGPRRPVRAPSVLWLRPGVRHEYEPQGASGWEELFVAFDGPAVVAYQRHGIVPRTTAVTPLRDIDAARETFMELQGALDPSNPSRTIEAGALLHRLLLRLRPAPDGREASAATITDALARDALLDLTVAERAARLGMSTSALRHDVRRSGGRGVAELVQEVRIDRAQQLLSSTMEPVSTIARMVGFEDPGYFSRVFRRRTGLAPSAFRDATSARGDAGERTTALRKDQSSS